MFKALKKRLKNQKGLTLIELLAVVVILGIIGAIAVPSISGIMQKSKEDAVKADAITVLNAAKLRYAQDLGADSDNSYDSTELGQYIDNVKFSSYTVTNTNGKFTLNASATAGNKTITFNGATLANINGTWATTGATAPVLIVPTP